MLARSGLDRAAEHRSDDAWLAWAWANPASRVLVIGDGRVLVHDISDPRLVWLPTAEAPDGPRYLLGMEAAPGEDTADGSGAPAPIARFAVAASLPTREGTRVAGLRDVGALLSDRDGGLLAHAVALDNWHRSHPRCARCGQPTVVTAAGHARRCPACGAEHFPRTDPAVIVLVTDEQDRCMLGRQPRWPERRFSVLAGFVEPGESLEQAVIREVAEEVGLVVDDVAYVASQPWPFPSSLMLGFTARAVGGRLTVDGQEIAQAQWFSRAELAAAVAEGSVLLPSPVSIARSLIEGWYGEPLPADNRW